MKKSLQSLLILMLVAVALLLYYFLGYEINRSDFTQLLSCFAALFLISFYLIFHAKGKDLSYYQGLALVFRLGFLFSLPLLSDDYFRFIWDGQLIQAGLNPFDLLPEQVQVDFPNKLELLEKMNSSGYYSIYPPLAQFIYFLAVFISPNSILGSVIVMRGFILLAEICLIYFLPKLLQELNINPKRSLWYLLNPLVIVELTGNLHMESIMLAFLLMAFYWIVKKKYALSSLGWALAAATKLIPLALIPMLWRKLTWKQFFVFSSLLGFLFLLLWTPLYSSEFFSHFMESFNLYFKSFEFNASLYYLLREIGYYFVGYNTIATLGVVLPKLALILMLALLLRKKNKNFKRGLEAAFFAMFIYYLFASIVHPWYVCTLLFLSLFTRFNAAILWSFTAVFSYAAYQSSAYLENYYLIALEYSLVILLFVVEFFKLQQFTTFGVKSNK